MADFEKAFLNGMNSEGGFKLTNIDGDRGGQTYAGVARRYHPNWPGWVHIDAAKIPPTQMVRDFYRDEFWNKLNADAIEDQKTAETIYNFAINADWRVAAKIVQSMLGVAADGVLGVKSMAALNAYPKELFHPYFALAKIKRYTDICNRDRSQVKFLLGWNNRTLEQL